jgi:hypothetical protein
MVGDGAFGAVVFETEELDGERCFFLLGESATISWELNRRDEDGQKAEEGTPICTLKQHDDLYMELRCVSPQTQLKALIRERCIYSGAPF